SAPKNLRRATTELNRKLMTPYLVDEPPWLKGKPLAVPPAMHHYYMAQAYLVSLARGRATKEIDEAIRLDPKNPNFHLLKMRIFLEQDRAWKERRKRSLHCKAVSSTFRTCSP